MRRPKLGVTGAATFGDFHKAKRLCLPNSRRNRVAMDAVALEVVIGDRQPAVIIATVIGVLESRCGRERALPIDSVRTRLVI